MEALIVVAVVVYLVVHFAGGARHHRRARSRGMRPNLYYTYGRGIWGSVRLPGGFRVGHKL